MEPQKKDYEKKLLELYEQLSDIHKELAINLLKKLLEHQEFDHD